MPALLLYDGDCESCTAFALRLAGAWTTQADVLAWQQLGTDGLLARRLTPTDARRALWWIDEHGMPHRGAAAVGHALLAARGWHGILGRVVLTPPLSWFGVPGYWAAARWRHRQPRAVDTTRHPAAHYRGRAA